MTDDPNDCDGLAQMQCGRRGARWKVLKDGRIDSRIGRSSDGSAAADGLEEVDQCGPAGAKRPRPMADVAVLDAVLGRRPQHMLRLVMIPDRRNDRGHARGIVNGTVRQTGEYAQERGSDNPRPAPESRQTHFTSRLPVPRRRVKFGVARPVRGADRDQRVFEAVKIARYTAARCFPSATSSRHGESRS